MIEFTDTALASAEPLKTFENNDALGKAYLELDGKVKSGSVDLLPEEIKKDPIVSRYKNITELAKGHIEANKIISGIKKPPETADGYKFTDMQNLHKGLSDTTGTKKALAAMFHKVGIDNDKADQLQQMILTGLSTSLTKNDESRATQAKEVETQLRSEWKENYDKNYNNVENVLKRIGLEDLVPDLKGNPKRLSSFHKLTSLLSEDSLKGLEGTGTGGKDTKSKSGAANRIKEIMDSPALRTALSNEKDPKHQEIKKEWAELHVAAYSA